MTSNLSFVHDECLSLIGWKIDTVSSSWQINTKACKHCLQGKVVVIVWKEPVILDIYFKIHCIYYKIQQLLVNRQQ